MDPSSIINILVSFVVIGIIVLLCSLENTLWGLYWVLLTLYLMVFYVVSNNAGTPLETLKMAAPVILLSFLITWLIQIFSSKHELFQEDKFQREMGLGEKVPDMFYSMYTGVLLLMITKISLFVGVMRKKLTKSGGSSTLVELIIYGLTLISFLLMIGMSLVIDFYVTDG